MTVPKRFENHAVNAVSSSVGWQQKLFCPEIFFFLIAFRCFSGKKSAQESGQTWGFKFVAKKKPYGPLRDRDWTVSGKVGNIQFSFTFKRKTKKSEILPWPDRDGTVTARFWNSKLAVLCTMPSPSSRLSNGGGNMIPKKCRHDLKTTATSWRQWTFDQGLFQNIQVGSSHSIMSFVLHCTSRARKDWLQYGVLGLGREWNLLWRASRTQWPNAYIMPLPFRRKANETLVAQVFVPLSHVFFQELRYTNSFISFALKHGLCSRTQGLARHSDMYLTM